MMKYLPGDLIEVIKAPDQGYWVKMLSGSIGVVIENIQANSSPNIYKVLIVDQMYHLHSLDMVLLARKDKE
mgnify:FL=1